MSMVIHGSECPYCDQVSLNNTQYCTLIVHVSVWSNKYCLNQTTQNSNTNNYVTEYRKYTKWYDKGAYASLPWSDIKVTSQCLLRSWSWKSVRQTHPFTCILLISSSDGYLVEQEWQLQLPLAYLPSSLHSFNQPRKYIWWVHIHNEVICKVFKKTVSRHDNWGLTGCIKDIFMHQRITLITKLVFSTVETVLKTTFI